MAARHRLPRDRRRRRRAAERAPDLPHAETLARELRDFRVKVSLGGHDSYGVGGEWREGQHDDLLLAVALALWCAQHTVGMGGAVF